jgi:2-keto-3-deoxy-6-phosphogluconate aldolase
MMEITKGQNIRLLDVFVIGPIMIYGGIKKSNLPKLIRFGMATIGVGTIYYNGKNYLLNKEKDRKATTIVKNNYDTRLIE